MTNNDLIYKIKRMKKVEPNKNWLVSNREFILKYVELDEVKENNAFAASASFFGFSEIKNRLNFISAIFQHKILAGAAAMAVVLLLAGSMVTAEAEGSLPGDRLYAVKTFMEKTQLAIAFNEEKRVALNFEFTEKRFDEFSTVMAAKKENSSPEAAKAAADNFKNQLKVAAQELNNAKNSADAKTAVSVARIADTKTAAYAKKLSQVKKELSDKKQDQVEDVASNIEELSNSALAVLVSGSNLENFDTISITAKIREKIVLAEEKIGLAQKNIASAAEAIKNTEENTEAMDSLALAGKLILEAKSILGNTQTAFEKKDFSRTWDLLTNASEIIKVAENVGSRVAAMPSAEPIAAPVASPSPESSASPSPIPSATPLPTAEPIPSLKASDGAAVLQPSSAPLEPSPSISPAPKAIE